MCVATRRMAFGVVLVTGCFAPSVQNGGFSCDPHDEDPCPLGFFCINGYCLNGSVELGVGGGGGDDLAPASDLAMSAADLAPGAADLSLAPDDLTLPPPDLTQAPPDLTQAPPDLSQEPPDLWTGMCGHAGSPCTSINDCCSQYCRTDGICIGG